MELKRYKVLICPHCGYVQTSSASVSFQCIRCKKSRKLISERVIGLNIKLLASFDHPSDATAYIQEYKKELASKRETAVDFESAA